MCPLFSYEAEFIQGLRKLDKKKLVFSFSITYRYIDDALSMNNPRFSKYLNFIYPPELEIKNTTESDTCALHFDCLLGIDNSLKLYTVLYDKHDDVNLYASGVFVSQLISYARACSE